MKRWAFILAALLAAQPALGATKLISDISQSRIDIEYSFSGANLLVFGAVQYATGRAPGDAPDIAIVVRGPAEPITVRRKARVAGVWLNTAKARYESAPGFYAVASSRPVRDMLDETTAAIYEIGLEHLQLSPASANAPADLQAFEAGLVNLRKRAGLYAENPRGVSIVENMLYSARIKIPSAVPVGDYEAQIFLIQQGRVIATTDRRIAIGKSGFERAVYVAAQDHSLTYGLVAVALALLAGWGAGQLTRRS
jgi:uncharacterized protein (TIGR02186 family)